MKTYNNAELQIVRMNNNDIVTTSTVGIGSPITGTGNNAQSPERRRSIWD
jgi:hypothetical protein